MRRNVLFLLIGGFVGLLCAAALAQKRAPALSADPACQTLALTSTGGPAPQGSTLVLRYLGASNYELAYRDVVLLFNAYYERTPRARPLGFTRDEIKRANALLIGHGHSDHMADAEYVAQHAGIRVFGGPPTIEYLRSVHVPETLLVQVKGGEVEKFGGMTVEAILAHHAIRPPEYVRTVSAAFAGLVAAAMGPPSEEERKQEMAINARGSRDQRIITEGTIAYLVSLSNGFHLIFQDSAGPVTDGERAVMQRIGGRADVAIVAYQGFFVSAPQIKATMPLVRAFKPRIFLPTHHDETGADHYPDMAAYPLFMAIRDELGDTRSIAPLYRSPICINTDTREVFVGH